MRQRGHVVLLVFMFIAAAVGVVGVGVFAITSGDVTGSGLSLLYAVLPLPAMLGCFFWLDRYEPEPWHYKLAAVVWGGVGAVAIALVAQIAISEWFDLSDEALATFIAPTTEEPAKALFLLLTFLRMRRVIDGLVDGLVFAGLVGLGFAFVENVIYYAGAYVGIDEAGIEGAGATTATFVMRGIMSPFAHPMFTAAFGVAIGLAVKQRSIPLRILLGAVGLGGSMLLHGIWNGGVSYLGGGGFLLAYGFTGLLLAGTIVLAALARRQQGRYLARALTDIARRGWLVADEIPYIASLSYRSKAVKHARLHGGPVSQKATRRYQRDAITMAFLYAGVIERLPKPRAAERVEAFLAEMRVLRPYVVLPPPLRFAYAPPRMPYGAPGYGVPGHGAPGYGAPGYGAPGYGAPGYGAPGYGGQAHGGPSPGYGSPGYGGQAHGGPSPGYGVPGYGSPGYAGELPGAGQETSPYAMPGDSSPRPPGLSPNPYDAPADANQPPAPYYPMNTPYGPRPPQPPVAPPVSPAASDDDTEASRDQTTDRPAQ